jgi:hypothetical protein
MSRYLLCAIAGLFWANTACAQQCHLSVSFEQLFDLSNRLSAIGVNINNMSSAASDVEETVLSLADESLNYIAAMLNGTLTVIAIRDNMVNDKDRQIVNGYLSLNLTSLSQTSSRQLIVISNF